MNYPDDFINKIICGDCLDVMKDIPDNSIDLVVTSPPYSDLRDYKKYTFDFESIANALFRIIKSGGVVVWVVGDKTKNGTEELLPYKQCLYFNSIGFNVWDTMIYAKNNCPFPANVRYNQQFEFMFVFSKGKVKTFNPIRVPKSKNEIEKILSGKIDFSSKSFRKKDGHTDRADSDQRMLQRIINSGKKD
jgi:site-specific DNA-methyltransferase (adenine-specific)